MAQYGYRYFQLVPFVMALCGLAASSWAHRGRLEGGDRVRTIVMAFGVYWAPRL
jgi:hypothetical protein